MCVWNELILEDLTTNLTAIFAITLEFCAQCWLSCLMGYENLEHSREQNKGPEVAGRVGKKHLRGKVEGKQP